MTASDKKLGGLSLEEIVKVLKSDDHLRAGVIDMLARDHSKEYLQKVNVNAGLLNQVSARFISSDKEWQE